MPNDSLLMRITVFALVRVFFFLGGSLLFVMGTFLALGGTARAMLRTYRSSPEHLGWPATLVFTPGFWIVVLAVGIAAALLGPPVYERHRMRGRGTLRQIKRMSHRTHYDEE